MKMYDNILKKVELYEYKRGIVYAKTDGKLYKSLKTLYILMFIYTSVFSALFVIGGVMSQSKFELLKADIFTVLVFTVGLVVSLVILRFKKHLWVHITSFALNILSCSALGYTFGTLLYDVVNFKVPFYYRHLVPLCLMVIFSLWLTVIAIRQAVRTNKCYKKIVENVYNIHKTSAEESSLTEEEWDEIIKNI